MAVTIVVLFGPMTVAWLTGRPLVLDCGDLAPAVCDQMWRDEASRGLRMGGSGPVTYVKVGKGEATTCSAVTIERGSFTFGLFSLTGESLC